MNINIEKLEQLIVEELSKTEIKKVAKEAAEKEVKRIFKSELEKEIIKALGKKATEKEISDVVKKVIKKLYKDLSITYPSIIDGIRI